MILIVGYVWPVWDGTRAGDAKAGESEPQDPTNIGAECSPVIETRQATEELLF